MAVMAQTSQQLPSSHRRCSMLRMCLLHRNQADKCTALDDSMHADRIRVYLQDPLSPLLLPGRQTVQGASFAADINVACLWDKLQP